jgi:8-oxo-dGTP pyrophosphatase MutT (NUDIX family)
VGWEIPMGLIEEEGEAPEQSAAREVEEETGWRPAPCASS